MNNNFEEKIKYILNKHFLENADKIFENSDLLRYINLKTKSANKDSKSR
jgi:hypothetical protein